MSSSNDDSTTEIDLEAEFEFEGDSDAGSDLGPETDSDAETEDDSEAGDGSGSTSLADRLDTATTVIWIGFLAFVVAVALIPVAAVGLGVAPFVSPPVGPYFAFVGLALVGTVAIIGVAILKG